MSTGNAVVDRALDAHGGEALWRSRTELRTTWTFHGMMFKVRLREGQLKKLTARISTTAQRVEIDGFPRPGMTSVYTPTRLEIRNADGSVASALDAPREAFMGIGGLRTVVWWTDLEMLYFAGYVLWNYAQLPFLLLWPGLRIEDAGTSKQGTETWDKVRVTFPDDVGTHSPVQSFYFGPDGRLRRHDYHVAILTSLARGARLIHETVDVGGLVMPSRIEIKLGMFGESYAPFPSLGFVDLDW